MSNAVLIANTVVEIIDEKINNGEAFTAFDITRAARSKMSDNVRHNGVRETLNEMFGKGELTGYTRELCTLNIPDSPQAFVYYPDTESPSIHPLVSDEPDTDTDDDSIDIDDDTDDDSTDTDDDTDDDIDDSTDDVIVSVTSEGRVNIPKKIISRIPTMSGAYEVLINGNFAWANPNTDGRVRVSVKQYGYQKVKIALNKDVIEITQA